MSSGTPILDYASPRPRSNMRLRSRSVVSIQWDHDRQGVRIVERVEALAGAIMGMAFACFVLLVMAAIVAGHIVNKPAQWFNNVTVTLSIFWLIEAVVLMLVIAQTWRRTVLQAREGLLTLRQISLFGTTEFRWEFNQVEDMKVVPTGKQAGIFELAELQFRVAGATPVHLYTDHLEREVTEISDALLAVMKR